MRPSRRKASLLKPSSLALFGLFLFFPGYYFYNVLLASGVIPVLPSGYYTVTSVVLLACFSMYLGKTLMLSRYATAYVAAFVLFVFWCLLAAFSAYYFGSGIYRQEAFIQVVETVGLWVVLYQVGLYSDLRRPLARRLFWISGILILANIAHYVATTGSVFFYVRDIYDASEKIASYQGFSRSALITGFICLSMIELRGIRLLLLISTAVFCLFVLGSRSELAAFVLVTALVFARVFIKRPSRAFLPAIGMFVLLLVANSFYMEFSTSRQMELFNLDESSSWKTRVELSSEAVERIIKNPLFGKVGGHINATGEGRYAHNILSAWDSFGLFGFLLYLTLMVAPTICAIRLAMRKKELTENERFLIFVSVSTFLLSLAAKSIFSPMPALAWGLYVSYRINQRRYFHRAEMI